MHIISHQGRHLQRPASFARHTTAQINYNPRILSVFQAKNRPSLRSGTNSMQDCSAFKGSDPFGF
jgi:hypothetical protein